MSNGTGSDQVQLIDKTLDAQIDISLFNVVGFNPHDTIRTQLITSDLYEIYAGDQYIGTHKYTPDQAEKEIHKITAAHLNPEYSGKSFRFLGATAKRHPLKQADSVCYAMFSPLHVPSSPIPLETLPAHGNVLYFFDDGYIKVGVINQFLESRKYDDFVRGRRDQLLINGVFEAIQAVPFGEVTTTGTLARMNHMEPSSVIEKIIGETILQKLSNNGDDLHNPEAQERYKSDMQRNGLHRIIIYPGNMLFSKCLPQDYSPIADILVNLQRQLLIDEQKQMLGDELVSPRSSFDNVPTFEEHIRPDLIKEFLALSQKTPWFKRSREKIEARKKELLISLGELQVGHSSVELKTPVIDGVSRREPHSRLFLGTKTTEH